MKKYLFLVLSAMLVPATAFAQTPAPTFSGPYVSVQGGWNQGQDKDVLPEPWRRGTKRSGIVARGIVGYDHAIGEHAVVGAELGIATGGRKISTANSASHYLTDPGITVDAVARLGLKPHRSVMLFGKVGWAFQRVETSISTPTGRSLDNSSEHGFLFGGGAEVTVAGNVALRAEFDRVSFDDHYKRNRALAGVSLRF